MCLCTCDTERDGMSFICVVVGFGVHVKMVRTWDSTECRLGWWRRLGWHKGERRGVAAPAG